MTWLPDSVVSRLREVVDWPDFSGAKYEILEKLGQGGMASMFVARDRELDRRVAIKVIHAPVLDPTVQNRMLAEARIIARLEHPGILPVHDLGFLPDGRIYYVMKLVRGRRLNDFVNETASLQVAEAVRSLFDCFRTRAGCELFSRWRARLSFS